MFSSIKSNWSLNIELLVITDHHFDNKNAILNARTHIVTSSLQEFCTSRCTYF